MVRVSKLKQLAATACVFLSQTGSLSACDDGFWMATLFIQHPEARTVYKAAERLDQLSLPSFSGTKPSRHAISMYQTMIVTQLLTQRFTQATELAGREEGITFFLAEEGRLIALGRDNDELVRMDEIDVYTTSAALRELLTGKTSLERSFDADLLLLTGDQVQQSESEQIVSMILALDS